MTKFTAENATLRMMDLALREDHEVADWLTDVEDDDDIRLMIISLGWITGQMMRQTALSAGLGEPDAVMPIDPTPSDTSPSAQARRLAGRLLAAAIMNDSEGFLPLVDAYAKSEVPSHGAILAETATLIIPMYRELTEDFLNE